MYLSSVQQLNGNSIKFFLSTQTRSSSKVLQSKFLQGLTRLGWLTKSSSQPKNNYLFGSHLLVLYLYQLLAPLLWSFTVKTLCYQGTVNVLSGHPRWMFRKNSMEFLLDCSPTYTITTVAVPQSPMVTCPFQNVLWSPDLVM